MYVNPNFKTKKALKEAITQGKRVTVYQPNQMFAGSEAPRNGHATVEGPHYPEPHKWYAQVEIKDGFVVKVK